MVAKTSVKEVQIYRSSATITRGGEAELTEGRNIIYISGMTESARRDSFRLKFPEGIKAVNIQIVGVEKIEGEEVKESERIRKQLDEIGYQKETLDMLLELRKTNSDFSGRSDISIEAQEKVMKALPEQMLSLHRQLDELTAKETKLQEALAKTLLEENRPVIMAEVVSASSGTVPFILQYQDDKCCWTPKYQIHYTNDKEPLEVCMKAQINQSSGEDWKHVKVTLYTGNPSVSNDLPEMSTHELYLYEEAKVKVRAKGAMMAARAMEDTCCEDAEPAMMGMAVGMAMNTLMMDTAEVAEEETMTAFVLPNARDIFSDTDGNMADLQNFSVKASYHVLAIPSVDNNSYLTAEIVASEWPLPPADAAVYLRDTFAGEVYVDADEDTDLLTLSLGRDERLNVIRTESPKKTSDVFLKGDKKQLCKAEIRLVNTSSEPVSALIKDQLPVSTEKAISIEPVNISDGILDKDTGELKWEIMAEPDKTVTLAVEYTIVWPKDKKLGTRRSAMNAKPKFCSNCGRPVAGRFCPECGAEVK